MIVIVVKLNPVLIIIIQILLYFVDLLLLRYLVRPEYWDWNYFYYRMNYLFYDSDQIIFHFIVDVYFAGSELTANYLKNLLKNFEPPPH